MTEQTGFQYIDGERRTGRGGTLERRDPATGDTGFTVDLASAEDVAEAVAAAQRAFADWSRTTPVERSELMLAWAGELEQVAEDLAALESAQTGKSLRLATEFDVPGSIDNVRFFAGQARSLQAVSAGSYIEGTTSMVRREPIGVVGSISPWNYPLQMAAWKILPAVAAGNTIVLKPSEMTPGTSVMFAEAATQAGIPAGVINIVTGTGPVAGEALVRHPQVRMTSFTGSTAVGRHIMGIAAEQGKRVHLELGGKAPFVVFDDADLEAAARGAVAGSLINGGQDCTAATRAYVQGDLYEPFVARVAELMAGVRMGVPSDPETDLGALISHEHRDRVHAMVTRAVEAGATVVTGGMLPGADQAGSAPGQPGEVPSSGAFYPPTLVTGAAQDSEIVQDEVFGPVLVVLPFQTDDEGIELANDTPYGLAASAWSKDVNRCFRASAEIQAGCVWLNDHISITSEMPHGGYKASGFGKDMSVFSLEEYTQVKHVLANHDPHPTRFWHEAVFRG